MYEVTLFCPQPLEDGKKTILYKTIKNFKNNGDGTVTFETSGHGKITTSLHWRLREVADNAVNEAPVAGNRRRGGVGY